MAREVTWTEIEDVEVVSETPLALRCRIGGREYWIPKSQVSDDSEVYKVGDSGTMIMSEWIATDRGLV